MATEWSSAKGGLSTFNRRLCIALAQSGAAVVCTVLTASDAEHRDARAQGVTLVQAPGRSGTQDALRLGRRPPLPDGFQPRIIIGHGRVTGSSAQSLAEDHYRRARRLHVIHMAPDDIEWDKPGDLDDAGEKAEQRTAQEVDLGRSAHRVLAVGPRLHQRFLTDFSPYDVPSPLRIDPGFDLPPGFTLRSPPDGSPWRVLLFGRMEDARLKGVELAARAVARAAERRRRHGQDIELIIRGAAPGSEAALRRQVQAWANAPWLSVVPRAYTVDADALDSDLKRASVVLMPSRSEGFGLAAAEAVVAQVPVLATRHSGFGQLLTELLPNRAQRVVVDVRPDDDEINEWSHAINSTLVDRTAAFDHAHDLAGKLAGLRTWQMAADTVLRAAENPE